MTWTQTQWPPKELTDNEAIIDHIRQQVKAQFEREWLQRTQDLGVHGVRGHLAEVLEEAEQLEDFPDNVLTLLRVAYDTLWREEGR